MKTIVSRGATLRLSFLVIVRKPKRILPRDPLGIESSPRAI